VPDAPHAHPHASPADAKRPHDHGAVTAVGLLHGLAGTSAVVALVPVTLTDRVTVGLGYLVAFGVGVTVAMTGFAVVAAVAVRTASARSLDAGRWVTRVVGAAGIVVGAFWVMRALG
jgi:ABC-type nickel/cobalt efflux system permease component RcnA